MNARIVIKNLDKANAKTILEHINAIKQLQKDAGWDAAVSVDVVLRDEAASGN